MASGTGRHGDTSYAFMNAAGYGHDWSPTMHPVRTEVREYLDSILPMTIKMKFGSINTTGILSGIDFKY